MARTPPDSRLRRPTVAPVVGLPSPHVAQLFQQGLAQHQSGNLTDAKAIYESVLQVNPKHFDARHLLGVIETHFKNYQVAADLIQSAIALHPNNAHFHSNLGNIQLELKQADVALCSYEQAIRIKPDFAEAYYHRGLALFDLCQFKEVVASHDKAIQLKPDYPEAYTSRGNALLKLNQLDAAVASYDAAIQLFPDFAEAHYNRGNALLALLQLDAAIASYERAIQLQPNFPEAYTNLGLALQGLKRPELAVVCHDMAIRLKPAYVQAFYNRGNAQLELKQYENAIASYDKVINLDPDFADAYYNRGNAQWALQQWAPAVASYDRAIHLRPEFSDAYCNRGLALKAAQQLDDALASYDKAISIQPDCAAAYTNRGLIFQERKQLDAAIESYEKAIDINPEASDAYFNRGNALQELHRLEEAVASYDAVIRLSPNYAEAYWNKSHALLCGGHYANGWELFEWRWNVAPLVHIKRSFTRPLWLGAESLQDKTILLHAEQGLGDTLQFCRYAPLVAALGARVILEVDAPLMKLLQCLPGDIALVPRGSAGLEYDFHCPIMSLPWAFKTTLTTIPSSACYLRADPAMADVWRQRLAPYRHRKRVGLVWSGGFRANQPEVWSLNARRNVTLDQIAALHCPDLLFVSLQKGNPAEAELLERKQVVWPDNNLLNFSAALGDFADTAALIENLDLVISVDTSTAHLAAAMGKPVWLLNRFDTCWRWLLEADHSPWYESVKIYRQPQFGDWDAVIQQVRQDLLNE